MLSEAGFSWQAPARVDLAPSGPALVTPWKVLEWDTWMFSEEAGQGRVLQADLETPSGVVRVFNVHLQSLYFSRADYDAVEEGPSRQEGLRLLGLVTRASGARALQAQVLRRRMEERPHPVVLAGDFNDTPMSYASRQLRKGGPRMLSKRRPWAGAEPTSAPSRDFASMACWWTPPSRSTVIKPTTLC